MTATTTSDSLIDVQHLVQEFRVETDFAKHHVVQAVSDVSFQVAAGETLGIVGESGSGKSTLARSLLMAPKPKSGTVLFQGADLRQMRHAELKSTRSKMQMVFQEPFGSLDPKWTVSHIVREPLTIHGRGKRADRAKRVAELLDLVGLDPSVYGHVRPGQLSGGQAQRVAIARALASSPALIICDEAVSSLDVLIQAQVLNLFEDLRDELGLSYIFIAHDLSLVRQVSDRVAVMYLGKLCEISLVHPLYSKPLHPYTAALLEAIPGVAPESQGAVLTSASVEPPSPSNPPSGCRYRTRCPYAQPVCAAEEPPMRAIEEGRYVACHFPLTHSERGSESLGDAVTSRDQGS
jgi:oligopeptide transport system ATP-binding protein